MSDFSLSGLFPPPGNLKYTFPKMTKSLDYASLPFYQHIPSRVLHAVWYHQNISWTSGGPGLILRDQLTQHTLPDLDWVVRLG